LWSSQGQNSAAKSENSVKEGKNLTSQRQNALERAKEEKKREAVLEFFTRCKHTPCVSSYYVYHRKSPILKQPAAGKPLHISGHDVASLSPESPSVFLRACHGLP